MEGSGQEARNICRKMENCRQEERDIRGKIRKEAYRKLGIQQLVCRKRGRKWTEIRDVGKAGEKWTGSVG
jgi:hypothetical protein